MSHESQPQPGPEASHGPASRVRQAARLLDSLPPAYDALIRIALWGAAFAVAYRAQMLLEDQHHELRALAYFIAAAGILALASWRGKERGTEPPGVTATPAGIVDRVRAYGAPAAILAAAAALGVAFRLYDLNSRPIGVWFDEAQNGLIARDILNGTRPPMFIGGATQLPSAFFYVYALSARVMGEGILSLRIVSTIGGLLALPMLFLLARELFGLRVAVIATFLLAVMRWHVNFSRFGVTNIWATFFVLGAAYFFVRSLRSTGRGNLIAAGIFVGLTPYAGFYGVFLPIVLILYWLHSAAFGRVLTLRAHAAALPIVAAVALAIYSPVLVWGIQNPDKYADRPGTASILNDKSLSESYHAVIESAKKHVLMFNSAGDRNGRHNLPGAPMLDTFTGLLFVLGLGVSLVRVRKSSHFMLIAWMAVFIQNGIWSVDFEAPQAFRTSALTAGIAMLAALPLAALWDIAARDTGGRSARVLPDAAARLIAGAAIVAVLSMAAWRNFDTYFNRQLDDPAVWTAFNADVSFVGRQLGNAGPRHRVLMPPLFDSPVVRYLAPQAVDPRANTPSLQWLYLDLTRDLPLNNAVPTAVFLDRTKLGYLTWIQSLYPDARVVELRNRAPGSTPLVWEVLIEPASIQRLMGVNARFEPAPGQTALERVLPSVDEDWTSSQPLPPPFEAHWSGTLKAETFRDHQLTIKGPGRFRLSLDGQLMGEADGTLDVQTELYKGMHSFEIDAHIDAPGKVQFLDQGQPVPASAFFTGTERSGLEAAFYDNTDWQGAPKLRQLDPFVGFRYHADIPFDHDFSAVWRGTLIAPAGGTYGFDVIAQGDATLRIDGTEILSLGPGELATQIPLTQGEHSIELRYRNLNGNAEIFLRWNKPGQDYEVIPASSLRPP